MKTVNGSQRWMGGVGIVIGLMMGLQTVSGAEVEVAMSAVPTYTPTTTTNGPASPAAGYSIVAGTTLLMGGTPLLSGGNVYANIVTMNGSVTLAGQIQARTMLGNGSGNTKTITGNTKALSYGPKIVVTGQKLTGVVPAFTNWPALPIETYRDIAKANGMYFTQDVNWNAPVTVPGGIVYCAFTNGAGGNFRAGGTCSLTNTCIIAEKRIDWNANTLTAPAGYPAMVVTEPNAVIDIQGGGTIRGLIYAYGSGACVNNNGNGETYGQIFCKGELVLKGTVAAVGYSNVVDTLVTGAKGPLEAIQTGWVK